MAAAKVSLPPSVTPLIGACLLDPVGTLPLHATPWKPRREVGDTGRVLVTDFAAEMLAAARRRAAELGVTNADFRQLDAERMDLASGSVDGVVCRWGYMLMADPAAALAETARVMRPDGRLAFAVFGAADRNPWISLAGRILVAEQRMAPPVPGAPGIFALSDPERIHELLSRAGFASPEVVEMPLTWRFASPDAHWQVLTEMAGVIAPVLRGLDRQTQAKVRAQLAELARPFRAGDGYAFPALCLNVATRKPA